MKTILRFLLLLCCAALLIAVYATHLATTQSVHEHEIRYLTRWPHLHELHQWSLFAILGWCIVFAKSEPTFVRIGLATIVVTYVIMLLPLRTL